SLGKFTGFTRSTETGKRCFYLILYFFFRRFFLRRLNVTSASLKIMLSFTTALIGSLSPLVWTLILSLTRVRTILRLTTSGRLAASLLLRIIPLIAILIPSKRITLTFPFVIR